MTDQYRIEWRNRTTGERGHQEWTNCRQGLDETCAFLNREFPETYHWVHDTGAQARHEKRVEERQNGYWPDA